MDRSFQLGVNLPWIHYAEDFGGAGAAHRGVTRPEKSARIAAEFERMRDSGVSVVRWFLFGDGRGGFVCEKGIPRRPDDFLLADVRAALDLAARFDLKLCLSLIDYLWLQHRPGTTPAHANERALQFAAGREALLHRVLIPVFRETRGHEGLFAWEIANEPEWAIHEFHRIPAAKMRLADFRAFAVEVAEAVREFAAAPVTLGSARLDWVRAWTGIGLDFYQAHYYPQHEGKRPDLRKGLAELHSLERPLWLGELPAHDDATPNYSAEDSLELCERAGVAGAAIWRWTAPEAAGSDQQYGSIDPQFLAAWNSSSRSRRAAV